MSKILKLALGGIALLTQAAVVHAASVAYTENLFDVEKLVPVNDWDKIIIPDGSASAEALVAKGTSALTINIDVDHTAPLYVWVRAYSKSFAKGTVSVKAGGLAPKGSDVPTDATPNTLQWIKSGPFILDKGASTVSITPAVTGLAVDKIVITAQLGYIPTDATRSPSNSNSLPAVPYWDPASVSYQAALLPTKGPRLFIREADIARLSDAEGAREVATTDPELAFARKAWQSLKTASATPTSEKDCKLRGKAIKAKALYYRLYGNATMGDEAVTMLIPYLDDCIVWDMDNNGVRTRLSTRPTGDMILLSALVYDWVLSTKPAMDFEKDRIIRRFLERAPMEVGFPAKDATLISGHGAEAQLLRDQLSAAIAFKDRLPGIYTIVAKRIFEDVIPVRNYTYQSGGMHQGSSYGPYRFQWDMFTAWIYRSMPLSDNSTRNVFDPTQQNHLYHSLYQRRPDGQLMRDGDVYHSNYTAPGQYWIEPLPFMMAANYYKDRTLKRELARQLQSSIDRKQGFDEFTTKLADELWLVLFSDPTVVPYADTVAPAENAQWPSLTRYFDKPLASMIARTQWTKGTTSPAPGPNNAAPVIATMKVGRTRFGGHQHRDAGHFEIYYKGPLASSSGIYQGKVGEVKAGFNSLHDTNYYKRTVAHNALLVFKENEEFEGGVSVNDGGQLFYRDDLPTSLADLTEEEGDKPRAYGSAIKHRIGISDAETAPAFSYLKGDISKAYLAGKAAGYERAFVFLNLKRPDIPAALIVLDRIQPSTYTKRWLLHSVDQATSTGTGEFTITARGGASRLVNKTLLPEKAAMSQVSGYIAADQPFPMGVENDRNTEELGLYRVELDFPASDDSSNIMLNVMQVVDNAVLGTNPLLTSALLKEQDGTNHIGVQVGNRAVFFGKTGTPATGTTLNIPAGVDLLVTDLASGTWSIKRPDSSVVQQIVDEEHGTIYLPTPTAGVYTLSRVGP